MDQANQLPIVLVLDEGDDFEKLVPLNLQHVPRIGECIGDENMLAVFEVRNVIYDPTQVTLIVAKTDPRLHIAYEIARQPPGDR